MTIISNLVAPELLQGPVQPSINYTNSIDSISLNCTYTGFPIPSITWLYDTNTVVIQDDNRVIIQTYHLSNVTGSMTDFGTVVSVLSIGPVTVDDTGLYNCVGSSSIGDYTSVFSEPVDILVQGN